VDRQNFSYTYIKRIDLYNNISVCTRLDLYNHYISDPSVDSINPTRIITFYVTDSGLHQSGRVCGAHSRGQDAAGGLDGRARLLVGLLEILPVFVVLAVATVNDRRALIVDPRWSDFLHRPLQRIVLIENLLAGQSNSLLVITRIGLVVLRFVAWRRYLLARSVYTQTFVGPLLLQCFFVLPMKRND